MLLFSVSRRRRNVQRIVRPVSVVGQRAALSPGHEFTSTGQHSAVLECCGTLRVTRDRLNTGARSAHTAATTSEITCCYVPHGRTLSFTRTSYLTSAGRLSALKVF